MPTSSASLFVEKTHIPVGPLRVCSVLGLTNTQAFQWHTFMLPWIKSIRRCLSLSLSYAWLSLAFCILRKRVELPVTSFWDQMPFLTSWAFQSASLSLDWSLINTCRDGPFGKTSASSLMCADFGWKKSRLLFCPSCLLSGSDFG